MALSSEFSRIRRKIEGTALFGACALSVVLARPAEACPPPEPGLTHSEPADGATYPSNAHLLFEGFGISLDDISVTVDDEPAGLMKTDPNELGIQARVLPEPTEGQTVVLSGSFCPEDDCEPVTITYTVGPPDLTEPEPRLEESFFTVYDHADFVSSGGDCMSDSDLTLYVHLSQKPPEAGQSTLFAIAWDPDGEGGAGFSKTVRVEAGEQVVPLPLVREQIGGKDPMTEVCLVVIALDAAQNTAETFEVCPACYARADLVEHGIETPPEPDWTEADKVPGSPCAGMPQTSSDDPTGTTGEEDTWEDTIDDEGTGLYPNGTGGQGGDQGCACSSGGDDPSGAGRFLLFALGLALALVKRRY